MGGWEVVRNEAVSAGWGVGALTLGSGGQGGCEQEGRALVGVWEKDFTWEEIQRAATITKGLGSKAGFKTSVRVNDKIH